MGALDPHLIHGSLGQPESSNPNGISIGSAVYPELTTATDGQTDHATRSVTIDRIYVRSTAMRPNKYPCLHPSLNSQLGIEQKERVQACTR